MRNCLLLFLLSVCCNCNSKRSSNPVPTERHALKQLDYFELSYRGGWTGGLSFCVDSNRIFFFPRLPQTGEGNITKYGLLPDSISDYISSLIPRLKLINSQNPDSLYCYDCSGVSIRAIKGSDTMRLFLAGDIDATIWKLIEKLDTLEKRPAYTLATAYFFTETMNDLMPPPPPKIK